MLDFESAEDILSWNGIFSEILSLNCRYGFDLVIKYRLQLRLAVRSYPHFWCRVLAIFDIERTR